MKSLKTSGMLVALFLAIAIPFYFLLQIYNNTPPNEYKKVSFVGKEKCIGCHKEEYNLWKQSHHSKAMAIANDSTVLGNFNNSNFKDSNGQVTTFYKRGNNFYVKTNGGGGKVQEYKITHTFGYTPLQQYLVPFDNGKYQCLPIAWNTKKKEWFSLPEHLYADENLTSTNWLYWTNGGQNWNGMCSECHSTNLNKNFNPVTKSFHTTYSEINVSCEACHGPGSKHLQWANLPDNKKNNFSNLGLVVKTGRISNRKYVENCMRCHSRRSQLGIYKHGNKDLLNSVLPTLLNESYYPDGQILDEDYVWGSFVQSKMYAEKVQCNHCHNVHSGKLKFEGNKLCAQCHIQDIYDTKQHHFHKYNGEKGNPIELKDKTIEVGEGAQCINCHMPGKYYMGVDFRRDHSFRIPRPDLTIKIGTPNACNGCHSDKTTKWANNYIKKWYNPKPKAHYGITFAAARNSETKAESELIKIVQDSLQLLIVRATAVSLMNRYSSHTIKKIISKLLHNRESLLRETALRVYSNNNAFDYKHDLLNLLKDSVKAVRAEAAIRISELPEKEIPDDFKTVFTNALNEYKEINLYMADFPSGRMNLGIMYANQGKIDSAALQYEEAIKIDSLFFPAKANLAIIYNQLGKNDKAEFLLRDLIKGNPEFQDSYYYLGLLLAEKKNYKGAIFYLRKASLLMPERARIHYNVGLMLQSLGKKREAEKELKLALEKEPDNFDFLYALTDYYTKQKQYSKAEKLAKKMKALFPSNTIGDELLKFINGKMK